MTVEDAMVLLRNEAIESGLQESAIVYGWSAIRLRGERILALIKAVRARCL